MERKERPLAPQVHPPIQPGATPEGRKRRFLGIISPSLVCLRHQPIYFYLLAAYNMVGAIATRDEDKFSAVEIEFADVNFHNKINITDHHNFTLAALNEFGAVFACRASVGTLLPSLSYPPSLPLLPLLPPSPPFLILPLSPPLPLSSSPLIHHHLRYCGRRRDSCQ